MKLIYLDHAATTQPLPEVEEAMKPYLRERFGNPSALYALGRQSRAAVEDARKHVAALVSAAPEEIYFTSGGSESDNMALGCTLAVNGDRGNHLITTSIEHHAVLETAHFLSGRGYDVTFVDVDSHGLVDPDDIRKAIKPSTVLVSVMHANNEVGTVQPICEIAGVCREAGVYLHTDAVQTVGNIPVGVEELGIDMLSTSAHKLHGPKGVGAIYIRKGTKTGALIHGGEQERGMRAGTENIAGIVGFGEAARVAAQGLQEKAERIMGLRVRLVEGVLDSMDDVYLNGHPSMRLPNNAHFGIRYVEGEAMCLQLDTLGICASTGSACTTDSLDPSHVLVAMGIAPQDALGSVRFSLGRETNAEDVDFVIERFPPVVERLRAMSPLARKESGGRGQPSD